MSERDPLGMDGRAIEWLRDGASVAPDGLLQASLSRARRTRQRPALLAILAGSPASAGARVPLDRRLVVVVSAALLALLVGLWIVGSTRERDPLLVVPPPSTLADRPTPTPAPSRAAVVFPTSQPEPPEPKQIQLFDQHVQLLIDASGTYTATADEATIAVPSIAITVERWPTGATYRLADSPGGEVRGSTLEEIADSIEPTLATMDAGFTRTNRTVDYHDAVVWSTAQPLPNDGRPFHVTLVIDDDVAYLFVATIYDPEVDGLILAHYARLESSIDFLVPTDVVVMDDRLSVWLPGDRHISQSTADVVVVAPNGRLLGLPRDLVIYRVPLGSSTDVSLQDGSGPTVTVEGETLDDVAASLERTSDGRLRRAVRARLELDGHVGYQWRYSIDNPLGSEYFGPIHIDVGVVVVRGDAYVILGVGDDFFKSLRFLG